MLFKQRRSSRLLPFILAGDLVIAAQDTMVMKMMAEHIFAMSCWLLRRPLSKLALQLFFLPLEFSFFNFQSNESSRPESGHLTSLHVIEKLVEWAPTRHSRLHDPDQIQRLAQERSIVRDDPNVLRLNLNHRVDHSFSLFFIPTPFKDLKSPIIVFDRTRNVEVFMYASVTNQSTIVIN